MSKENKTLEISVLAAVLPPFTYFDPENGFIGGIDILALRFIAKQFNFRIVLTKADDLNRVIKKQPK